MPKRWMIVSLLLMPSAALAQNATTAMAPSAPHPTLENLSIVWPISGDADADGVVTVRYRVAGETAYRDAMPLFRIPAGTNSTNGFSWSDQHAGSVFDLVPATTYEIELSLDDPDGGSTTATLTVTTRAEPAIPAGAREVQVTPDTFAAAASSAVPGDVLVLADGTYAGFTFDVDGTADQPIAIRAANPGGAIVDGEIRLDERSYVFLLDLTIHDRVVVHDTEGVVVRGCTIDTPRDGIVGQLGGARDGYFCDNRLSGPCGGWDASITFGVDGCDLGEGIQITGPGSVVCHNAVHAFRDCLSTMEADEAVEQYSIDFIENDLELCTDDAIEADYSMGNVRVLRNRITNSFMGISSQPSLGGPTYFVRNAMFNVFYEPFKLHNETVGDIVLHNTVVKCGDALAVYDDTSISRALFRNNLVIGGEGGGTYGGYDNGSGRVIELSTVQSSTDLDYDGFGSVGTGMFGGQLGSVRFASLAELQSMTTEVHAVEVDDIGVFAASVEFPSTGPFPERAAPDLRLAAGSAPVDRGVPLANVDDGFVGAAPDLGAYEAGSLLPSYGPRVAGAPSVCGNGSREGTEECDDGNAISGDGCSAICTREAIPGEDGGVADDGGATDAGGPGTTGGGCCSVIGARSGASVGWCLAALALVVVRRRRARPRR